MVGSRIEVYSTTETIVRTITSGWNGRTVSDRTADRTVITVGKGQNEEYRNGTEERN
jgi:hypothetical protein